MKKNKLYICCSNIFWSICKKIDLFFLRLRLRNKDFTIISNDCIGGFLYKKYNLRLRTPTAWVRIKIDDFPIFVSHLRDYLSCDLIEDKESGKDYPVGMLVSSSNNIPIIRLFFLHYRSFSHAEELWSKRIKRINFNNIYVVCDGTDDEMINNNTINEFNDIKYKKVYLCRKDNNMIENSFCIDFHGMYQSSMVFVNLPGIKGQHFERRFFDQFNWTKWLNGK